ncbi:sigma-54 factor interaction domain-containing protein [Nitrosococcus halophilus Nc 4]|uniref:Sigma-54 factor interaction domain-containing protein n=1 Tax=Nitrosococcus halophilus (strain Nc4) TaxID=472759 RepID=D5BWD2_NITHN|nr:sigma-54 dependent transcriptional regulator [Nitrosococcus halophilus]ADE13782.1 sigma-54 factor interaction domain-containing protein [Nitrosococcus halophilus Nc 4]
MKEHPLALIVDDEPDILELLELTLAPMGVACHKAVDLAEARQYLQQHSFDLCLTDMRLPDGDGIELVRLISQHFPETPVAVITAHGSVETAVEALKSGAFDFISKPVDLQALRNLTNAALRLPLRYPQRERRTRYRLLGESAAMRAVRSKIAKLARSQAPVYISGESGTGKELVARLIHEQGPRLEAPFVPVNCGAIPNELMESEFFGHKKGSFTGATHDKRGLFQTAGGGTLFLDEVADLPLPMQVKLLRAIQEKSVRPIGSEKEISVDVRILCATHKDLAALVKEGSFRQDLFYRLNVIELPVPPLRQRASDIPQLAEHILSKLAGINQITCPKLTSDALEALQVYPFPGNVRELENTLERAMTLCDSEIIEAKDLHLPKAEPPSTPTSLPVGSLEECLEGVERRAILQALERTHYNKTAAAKLLGITFRALRYRLKKLELE